MSDLNASFGDCFYAASRLHTFCGINKKTDTKYIYDLNAYVTRAAIDFTFLLVRFGLRGAFFALLWSHLTVGKNDAKYAALLEQQLAALRARRAAQFYN